VILGDEKDWEVCPKALDLCEKSSVEKHFLFFALLVKKPIFRPEGKF
jgi:hypothetical protein